MWTACLAESTRQHPPSLQKSNMCKQHTHRPFPGSSSSSCHRSERTSALPTCFCDNCIHSHPLCCSQERCCPTTHPRMHHCCTGRNIAMHTSHIPTLLYIPAHYIPIPTSCSQTSTYTCTPSQNEVNPPCLRGGNGHASQNRNRNRPTTHPPQDPRRGTSSTTPNTSRPESSGSENSTPSPLGKNKPWFQSAAAQFSDKMKEGLGEEKQGPRGRDEWACEFCGFECFCEGLPG